MSKLTTILGAMIIDPQFRMQMETNRAATLAEYQIVLTNEEQESLENMMLSFGTHMFDPCIQMFDSECPNWPCASFMMSVPSGRVGTVTTGAKKPPAKKDRKPVRPKGAKKASGKKTGKRKKSSRS